MGMGACEDCFTPEMCISAEGNASALVAKWSKCHLRRYRLWVMDLPEAALNSRMSWETRLRRTSP